VIRGMYLLKELQPTQQPARGEIQLLGSGAILREVEAAATILVEEYRLAVRLFSVTSFNELRRDGLEVSRWNRLHPEAEPRLSHVEQLLGQWQAPVVAATDYLKSVADQIREFVPGCYRTLGTDGFGRSDSRAQLRRFFEVDRHHVVVTALKALADEGVVAAAEVSAAIVRFGIDADRPIATRL
jgi:pyruvate dehydrogenase E1 component